MAAPTLTPIITGTPGNPLTYNVGIAETFSWIPVSNDRDRPLYARAGYITNLSDLSISLSASDLNIGSVTIKDGDSGAVADVVSDGGQNALRVVTQDFESTIDSITIGDTTGNFASVDSTLSALKVTVIEPDTQYSYYSIDSIDIYGTGGFPFTNVERPILALRVKPNTTRTIVVDEYSIINTDTSHICAYRWFVNPTLGASFAWTDLTPNIQYAFLSGNPTSSTISGALSTIKHSGVFAGRNAENDEGASIVTLTGGATPPVLVLALQHANGNTESGAFLTLTVKDLG